MDCLANMYLNQTGRDMLNKFSKTRPPFIEDDAASIHTELNDYDPTKFTPVLYGPMHAAVRNTDNDTALDFDPAVSHPACIGQVFVQRPSPSPPPPPAPAPPKKTCSPRVYLEHYIFPTLLPALEEMLRRAKKERCFERKRTKFSALDFLTEHLYKKNPFQSDRENIELLDIPFVQEWLKDHPRPPLPLSLLWTEEEAALVIQSHWRGYCVRKEPEIAELRQWQREWREENENIRTKVSSFWDSKMPEQPTPHASVEALNVEQTGASGASIGSVKKSLSAASKSRTSASKSPSAESKPRSTPSKSPSAESKLRSAEEKSLSAENKSINTEIKPNEQ